jgi:hypothetical protein
MDFSVYVVQSLKWAYWVHWNDCLWSLASARLCKHCRMGLSSGWRQTRAELRKNKEDLNIFLSFDRVKDNPGVPNITVYFRLPSVLTKSTEDFIVRKQLCLAKHNRIEKKSSTGQTKLHNLCGQDSAHAGRLHPALTKFFLFLKWPPDAFNPSQNAIIWLLDALNMLVHKTLLKHCKRYFQYFWQWLILSLLKTPDTQKNLGRTLCGHNIELYTIGDKNYSPNAFANMTMITSNSVPNFWRTIVICTTPKRDTVF